MARPVIGAAWRARLIPVDPGWLALAEAAPLMSTKRAAEELGWRPTRDAVAVLRELVEGLHEDAGEDTPPLAERTLDDSATEQPETSTDEVMVDDGATTAPAPAR